MILAAQYYRPPFPERRYWKEDLAGMKAAGLNAVQLWVLWSWVEPAPGRFVFDDYDELVEEAGRLGLKVVLSTIAELHPFWIHREIPDSHMVDHMGRPVISTNRGEAHQGLTPGGCTDNPEVLRRMGVFLQTVAGRYAGADNLAGWAIWNELRWNVQADGLVCFCPHTLAAFRRWLDARYGGLEGLNAAWKRRYCDWADVMPGKLPRRPYTEMMEFEKFLQWRAAEHMRFRAAIIKAADPHHIVTAHGAQPSAHMAGDAENHAINRGNDWDLVEPLDGLGCSHFPFWFAMSDADFGVRVECTRSAAGNKTVWVSELQGGSARQGFDVRPSVEAKPQQRWVWNGFGRGAKAVIFWCWRDEFFGRESSGYGLAGRDGLADERIALMKQTGALLREHDALLEAYRPDPARVGVLFDPNGYNLEWTQDGAAIRARDSVIGYLTALEHLQVPYTVVESSHLDALRDLRLLVLPFPLAAPDAAVAQALAHAMNSGTFRPYHSSDVRGVELGGATKNVLAIAAGIVNGRGLGASALAAMTTRGFAELVRFGKAYGAKTETMMGLSGLGDLILTCSTPQSRNFSCGVALGKGEAADTAAHGKLAEGVFTAPVLLEMAREKNIEMPISEAVAAVLAGQLSVDAAIESLLTRPLKSEE
jgi:beta-galactosidase